MNRPKSTAFCTFRYKKYSFFQKPLYKINFSYDI